MQRQREQTATSDAPGHIASLDVVVRPAKRTGRGLSTIIESPVKILATQLGLPVHVRDTFTGWSPPQAGDTPAPINMIIAVSFGLFVPKRLLRGARYGGLNVHPSLLPDLYGAAPIEHAVLLDRPRTGVTVQTLDETTFDGGRKLLQGPVDEAGSVGLTLPPRCTSADLHGALAPIGANLLVEVLRRGLYLPEHASVNISDPSPSRPEPAAAPKFTKADRQVVWHGQSAVDIDRQARALGDLWTHLEVVPSKKVKVVPGEPAKRKRAIFENIDLVPCPDTLKFAVARYHDGQSVSAEAIQTATFIQETAERQQSMVLPFAVDGESIVIPVGVDLQEKGPSCLRVGSIKIEGEKTKPAVRAMAAFAHKGGEAALNEIVWDVVLKK
ncbi:Methionyl-tRNA formyltransferase [Sporothrix eucalyptigena]